MQRLVLALVALFMGVLAQVGPAQARTCADNGAEIGAMASVVAGPRRAAPVAAARAVRPSARYADEHDGPAMLPAAQRVPTVLQGIDRSRE